MNPVLWKKNLYEKQLFPDNYVDKSFLEQLETNVNVRDHDYWNMVLSSAKISQQISVVLIFYCLFLFLRAEKLSLLVLSVSNFLLVTIGYIFLRWKEVLTLDLSETLRGCLLFCATLSIMSPVLRTLTKTFAEDTIWALAISLTIIHLLSHDYTLIGSDAGRIDGTISLNAAIFTSVLLASRLQSNEHVFTFILLAVEMFALFPIFQQKVKVYSNKADIMITITLNVIACIMTWYISTLLCFSSILVTMFLTFICPLWFMHVQEYKNEILGPWDIAHVQSDQ